MQKPTILIVDDNINNIKVLSSMLTTEDYTIHIATDGEKALRSLKVRKPDLILLDVRMPKMDGYEVCKRIKENESTRSIPVIFVTALSQIGDEQRGLELGAIDYITKPINEELVKMRIRNILELKKYQDNLEELVDERTIELKKTQNVIIQSLGIVAEFRDLETGEHIQRTTEYIRLMLEYIASHCEELEVDCINLDKGTIELITRSAPLHDIGKVAIPDKILLKPGKLTEDEFEVMKRHALYGRNIIRNIIGELDDSSFLKYAEKIAESHHEKWDGSGYPFGLAGEDIPLIGRIMALVDVYDALRTKRVYKEAFSHEKSKNIILEGKGKHFDPMLVHVFTKLESKFNQISEEIKDSEYWSEKADEK